MDYILEIFLKIFAIIILSLGSIELLFLIIDATFDIDLFKKVSDIFNKSTNVTQSEDPETYKEDDESSRTGSYVEFIDRREYDAYVAYLRSCGCKTMHRNSDIIDVEYKEV